MMDNTFKTKHINPALKDKLLHQGNKGSSVLSKDSGISSFTGNVRGSQESTRSSTNLRSSSQCLSSTKSSLKGDNHVLRDVTFDFDDASTYTSSSTIRELMKELDSAPVKVEKGEEMYYDSPAVFSPRQSRAGVYDSLVMSSGVFPDTDSGFSSSYKSKLQSSDDFTQSPQISPGALVRSRSLSRLNAPFVAQEMTPFQTTFRMDRSIRNLRDNLEDSENRRCVLMHKLKEAQDTLELQSERLSKIETAAKGNTILVEDLRLKERDYRRKIDALHLTEQEKEMLKMENIKLRQDMQDRIDKLDFALRSLQAQHQVTENENQKRIVLLEQTGQALSMLENENTRLQQDRESMRQEMAVAKEAITLARSKFEPMEEENKDLRVQVMRLKEENAELTKKVAELSGQLMELRKLTSSMKDENEKLASSWKTLAEEKQKMSRQLEASQEKASDLKSKASSAAVEKDRLFHEKMDLNNKYQQLLVTKEQLDRKSCVLEEQMRDAEAELTRAKQVSQKREEEKGRIEEEVHDLRKANQDLSSELSSVKAYYERALEQIGTLENGKKVQQQQHDWATQEQERLKAEVDRLGKVAEGKTKELKREKEEMEETVQGMKSELRNMKNEKNLMEDKIEELETKLHKANDDLKYSATVSQEELDTWKDTCDRLTASVSRKESEIQALSEKCLDLEDMTAKLQGENRALKEDCEQLTDKQEDVNKMKEENRKLLREKAENEQMIKLLETQKEVLTKSSENQLAKLHDVEQLTSKVEQFRNENEHLRERVLELEKVRDNLVNQKEELLASTELIYKKPKLEELEKKVEELREANRQLRDINDTVNEKCESLEQRLEENKMVSPAKVGSASQDQFGSQNSKAVADNSLRKVSISDLRAGISPSRLSQRSRSLPYPPGSGKMSVMNSRLGPVLVGEDVVYENDLKPGDKENIIVDPKFGVVLVTKQDVPFSEVGHVLSGKRVVPGSKMVSDRDRRKIPSKFGPVLMKEKILFEENLKPEDKEKIIIDPVFGKVLVSKEKDPSSSTGFTQVGRRVLSASDSMKPGRLGIMEGKYDIRSFDQRRSKSADGRTSLGLDRDALAQTRSQVYIDTAMGPVLVEDDIILESDLTPEDHSKIICDPKFGNLVVKKTKIPGSELGEILVGKRVVPDLDGSERRMSVVSGRTMGDKGMEGSSKFVNTQIGPVLMEEKAVAESELSPEQQENVIFVPEIGRVLVKRHSVAGPSSVGSVLVGQRVCLEADKEGPNVIDSSFGQILLVGETVNQSEIMSEDEEFIVDVPGDCPVLVCKEVVPNSEAGHVLVGKKIVSDSEGLPRGRRAMENVRPSITDPKQSIVNSGLGPIFLSEQTVLESDLDPCGEETVVIDAQLGPILVSKHTVPNSEFGHILTGKLIVSESQQHRSDKHTVIQTDKGPVLVNDTVLASELTAAESRNIVHDPKEGDILVTKNMIRDDKLGYIVTGRKVLQPLKASSGKNVVIDSKDGKVLLTEDVVMDCDIDTADASRVIEDPKFGRIFITDTMVKDLSKGKVKVGKRVISGTKLEDLQDCSKTTIMDKKLGRVEVDSEVVLETDLTAQDKAHIVVDSRLGPVLVTKKPDGKSGTKLIAKRIVKNSKPYMKSAGSKLKERVVKDKKFGNVVVDEDVVFDSEIKPGVEQNILYHPELGAVLVTDEQKIDSKNGKVRVGKRIVAGKRIPKRSKIVTNTRKGKVMIGGEVVLEGSLSSSERRNVVETEFGPVLVTNQSVNDSVEGKVLVGKRIVKASEKFDPMSSRIVLTSPKVGPVLVQDVLVLDSDITPQDEKNILYHETEGPILVTSETATDPKLGTVFVGKKVVRCRNLPTGKELLVETKRGIASVQSEPIPEWKLTQSDRENIMLHPEVGPLLITKDLTTDVSGRSVLVGKRVAFESSKFKGKQPKVKYIKDNDHGVVCVGDQVVYENDLNESHKRKLIFDSEKGAVLVTNDVIKHPEYGRIYVGKRVVKGDNKTKGGCLIQTGQGHVAVNEDVVFGNELTDTERERIVLDPELGPILITDQIVSDRVKGKVKVGKRVVSSVMQPLSDQTIETSQGRVVVTRACISEQDLTPADRENIFLDKELGPVLITKQLVNTGTDGKEKALLGKRILPADTKQSLPSMINTQNGKVIVEEGTVTDLSLTPEERGKVIIHPELGLVLITDKERRDDRYGRVLVGKRVLTTMKDSAGSKVVHSDRGTLVLADDTVTEDELSATERESVVLDPLLGPILVTNDVVDNPVIGKALIGKRVKVRAKCMDPEKSVIDYTKGKVYLEDTPIHEADLNGEDRGCIILDPEVGPVLVTKEIHKDPVSGQGVVGRRVLLSKRGAHGEKVIESKKGVILIGHSEVLEDALSQQERESIIIDPEIGPVLVTKTIVEDPITGRALSGKRVVMTSKKADKGHVNTSQGKVCLAEHCVLESELLPEERECVYLDPDVGPVMVTSQTVRDPTVGKALVGKKIIMDKTGKPKQDRIISTKYGEVFVGQESVLEGELTDVERGCIVLNPDFGPLLITHQTVDDPSHGNVIVGRPIVLSQRGPSTKKIINSGKGPVLVGETSIMEEDLTDEEKQCVFLDPEVGPVVITKETVLDPQYGYVLKGKKVVLGKKGNGENFVSTSKGKVFVSGEEVSELLLTPSERGNIVLDPVHGAVLVTQELVQDKDGEMIKVGKQVVLTRREPSDKIRISHDGDSILVGEDSVLECDLSPLERESVILDPDLGMVLVTNEKVLDPIAGTALIGKKIIMSEQEPARESFIKTKAGRLQREAEESEIIPSARKQTDGKSVEGLTKSATKRILRTEKGPVWISEQVINECDLDPADKIIFDPQVGPVYVTKQTVPNDNYGRVLVGKRVVRESRRGSALKYLERVNLSTDQFDQLDQSCEELMPSPAKFYIKSDIGPVYVERIFAPGTEKGFILKGTLTPAQADNIVKTHKNQDIVLETELGPIFVDTSAKTEPSLNFADIEEVPLEGSISFVYIPKGRILPQVPNVTSEMRKYQLISDSSVFGKMKGKGLGGEFVSKSVQTFLWPLVTMETQTVLDSEAMTFLTGKFYYEENLELKEAVGGDGTVVPKYDLERVREEKVHLEDELGQVRRELDGLRQRHEQYVEDYGPDGEEILKERNRVNRLEREKEGLEKQVALINGQLLLVEGSKKRLDEVVEDLQQEIVHLRKELEEAEKQPATGPELDQLQTEVEDLRSELTRSQKEKIKQEHLVKTLKEELDEERNKKPTKIRESLDDVGTELSEMRGELHKLVGVIQSKDQAIETLENQLRQSKEKIEDKDKAMLELKNIMKDSKGSESAHSAEEPLTRKSSTEEGKGAGESSSFSKKPKESNLIKRLKPAESNVQMQRSQELSGSESDLTKPSVTPGLYGAKYVGSKPQRTQSLTEKGSGDRLQSLISKYRSYGDNGSQVPERKIKPLSLSPSNKMGLVTRGRSFGPAAPKGNEKDSKVSEKDNDLDVTSPLLPTTPPPPLVTVTSPHREGPLAVSSPTPPAQSSEGRPMTSEGHPMTSEGHSMTSVDKQNRHGDRVAVSGEYDEDDGAYGDLDDDDLDTQEQRDINSLIQKSHLKFLVAIRRQRSQASRDTGAGKKQATPPTPILSVNPPKITSKVIGDLLRTSNQSQEPEHHPGSPPMSPDITAANQNLS